jgi:alpha-N-arabinofuranosidase
LRLTAILMKPFLLLEHEDLKMTNTVDAPNRVAPHTSGNAALVDGGKIEATLGKASWNVIRIKL